MPLVHQQRIGTGGTDAEVCVWRNELGATEALAELPAGWRGRLPQHPERIAETISARRALLHLLPSAAQTDLHKDVHGKPQLPGGAQLSLSHSHGSAAALVADRACGVDLQVRVEKIVRLRSKFERADERVVVEAAADEVAALHVLWGAKEALFKLWGKREIDWQEHLRVGDFQLDALSDVGPGKLRAEGNFCGAVHKGSRVIKADLWYGWIGDFCLVTAVAVE